MATRRFRLTPPRIPESALHQQVAQVLAIELAPPGKASRAGTVWWSVDIANYGGKTPGLRTKRGVIAGIPDIYVQHQGRAHFIELKAPEGGVVSVEQRSVGAAIQVCGGRWEVARSAEQVLAALDAWNIPRRNSVQVQ